VAGETPPDHPSSSPASDAAASQTASEIVRSENDALSNSGELQSEQEVFDSVVRGWREKHGIKGDL
jgi:hypothetical protein